MYGGVGSGCAPAGGCGGEAGSRRWSSDSALDVDVVPGRHDEDGGPRSGCLRALGAREGVPAADAGRGRDVVERIDLLLEALRLSTEAVLHVAHLLSDHPIREDAP